MHMGAAQRWVTEPLGTPQALKGFPRVERYLAHLPDRIDSYPACRARASVYRSHADFQSLRGVDWAHLPRRIVELLRAPSAPSEWISEVASVATLLAIADHLELEGERLHDWFRQCSTKMLSQQLFAPLMSLASPELMVKHAPARWESVHRGVGFGMVLGEKCADATLTYPPFLFPEELVHGHGEGICAALSLSRARDCAFTVERITPRSCAYRFTWS